MMRRLPVMSVGISITITNLRVAIAVKRVLFALVVTFVSAVGGLTNDDMVS